MFITFLSAAHNRSKEVRSAASGFRTLGITRQSSPVLAGLGRGYKHRGSGQCSALLHRPATTAGARTRRTGYPSGYFQRCPPAKKPPRSSSGFAAPHGEALLLGRSGGGEGRRGRPKPSRGSAPPGEAASSRCRRVLTQPALRAGAARARPPSGAASGSPGSSGATGRPHASAAGASLRRLRPALPLRGLPGRRDRPAGGRGPSSPAGVGRPPPAAGPGGVAPRGPRHVPRRAPALPRAPLPSCHGHAVPCVGGGFGPQPLGRELGKEIGVFFHFRDCLFLGALGGTTVNSEMKLPHGNEVTAWK